MKKSQVTLSIILLSLVLFFSFAFLNISADSLVLHNFRSYDFRIWQFFTYSLTHGNLGHLLSNCLFMAFFGSKAEWTLKSKIFLYHMFILSLFSGPAEILFSGAGSICGMSGLVNFAITIVCLNSKHWIYKIVLPLLILDDLLGIKSQDNIAHMTHLAGYAYGFYVYHIEKIKNYEKQQNAI